MPIYTTPVFNINLKKIIKNYNLIKGLCPNTTLSAVIKDNAYGLGAIEVAKALYQEANCRNFFVAHASEGATIRPHVQDAHIYVLQGIGQDSLKCFQNHKLIPAISTPEMLAFWHQNKIENIRPIIHIETGLNRLGFKEEDLAQLNKDELAEFSFVLSHLACADEDTHPLNCQQLAQFNILKNRYFPNTPCTLSASGGIFLGCDYHFDMLRLGAALYGINSAPYSKIQPENVIEIKAPVLQIKNIKKGESVGYSASFVAPQDMQIAIISIGYGDGIPRSLSNNGNVVFYQNNKAYFCPIVGRVSMDNIICNTSQIKDIKIGDFGYIINQDQTINDVAPKANTIAYELISNFGKNPRYIKQYIK